MSRIDSGTSRSGRHAGPVIAHVIPFYPPRLGGMERVAQSVAELLAERHRVEVITTMCGAGRAPAREWQAGVRVRRYRAREFAHTPLSLGLVLRLLALPRTAIVHAHVAQAFLPEMVWLTSLLRRRPFIIHFHLDVDATGRFGWLLPTYKRLVLGPVLRRAAAVVALSPTQARFLTGPYRVPENRVSVIPNGVGRSFGAGEKAPARRDRVRLLFVGRLDAQKNVTRLLDALGHVSAPIELVVVGDGEQRAHLEEHLRRSNLPHVRLVGAQAGAELLAWYRWADVFVLPSDKEGMPLVLLEAMASGLVVVATDVPGTHELVEGVGILANARADALGAAIQLVSTDAELRAKLAERSLERASAFSWDERIRDFERLYEEVARGR